MLLSDLQHAQVKGVSDANEMFLVFSPGAASFSHKELTTFNQQEFHANAVGEDLLRFCDEIFRFAEHEDQGFLVATIIPIFLPFFD